MAIWTAMVIRAQVRLDTVCEVCARERACRHRNWASAVEIAHSWAANLALFVSAAMVSADRSGARRALHRRPLGRAGPAGRLRLGSRHPCGDARPCRRRHARPVGAAGLVGARLQHGQVCGRGLSDLARPQEDLRPSEARRRRCRAAGDTAMRGCSATASSSTCSTPRPRCSSWPSCRSSSMSSRGHVAMQVAVLGPAVHARSASSPTAATRSPPARPATG